MATPKYSHAGQPMKYQTVEALDIGINEYFDNCDNRIQQVYSKKSDGVIEVINPEPYTMAGLAYSLGIDRITLLNYSKNEQYFSTVKKAREKVQTDVERRLMEGQPTGAIFNLKNNFGYVDQQQQDITSGGDKLSTVIYMPEPIKSD